MKKHIFLLLILFFAAYNTCAGQTSRYKLVTTSSLVPPEGGKLEYSLAYTAAGDSGKIKLVTSEVKLLDYEISSPLVTSVTNISGTFFIEVAMIHPDYSASGQVRLHINVVDDNEVLWITLSYLQEPYSEFFGGRITLNGPEIYPLGTLPPIISSYRPAMGGLYLVDNPELTYTWEKKTATAQEWTTMPGQNGETCQPDVTGKETVYYRRKATRSGGQTAYSNTVEVLTALDAGLISMSLSEDNRYVIINDKKSPSVAWEHTRIEESTDLENWETISTGEKTAKKLPDRLITAVWQKLRQEAKPLRISWPARQEARHTFPPRRRLTARVLVTSRTSPTMTGSDVRNKLSMSTVRRRGKTS